MQLWPRSGSKETALASQGSSDPQTRLSIDLRGAVQGVGFRPFVYRLACELELAGTIYNTGDGVHIEMEGTRRVLAHFLNRLPAEAPPRSAIYSLESRYLSPVGHRGVRILASQLGHLGAVILPDIACCADCLAEIRDPQNRRFRYPFTNCTNCGPRFTIISALPYDRPSTSMGAFAMCRDCQREYEDPVDRRFHAQPNACPACGPQLEFCDPVRDPTVFREAALHAAAEAILQGAIVALKGLGGFHLIADAGNESAVRELRRRKNREEKPFALMFPHLGQLLECCRADATEQRLLQSPEAPIVLLQKRPSPGIALADTIAPGNPWLGAMLPYTPLHHLLLQEVGRPVVATSGNATDEPICIENREALTRLCTIADTFLLHNRPILRHADDSIVRVIHNRELVLRRARGYAPLPLSLPAGSPSLPSLLAVGGQLKNSFALLNGKDVFISQHNGDLETLEARRAFEAGIRDLSAFHQRNPEWVACDLHPDYSSTHFARRLNLPLIPVQHHHAHVLSCAVENQLEGEVLGVSWDGTGFGPDGVIWGGEFLRFDPRKRGFQRLAAFHPFRLPGGEAAIREPRRAALGLLFELDRPAAFPAAAGAPGGFTAAELKTLHSMLAHGVNSPWTSSVGRLFDAVAALIGLRQINRFEGQGAMELEFCLPPRPGAEVYPFTIIPATTQAPAWVDWRPLLWSLLEDRGGGKPAGEISTRFHNTLSEIIVQVATQFKIRQVVLSGGCFQNRYLSERSIERLTAAGFEPYWHQRVPPNDGGIALGQIAAAVTEIVAQPAKENLHVPGSSRPY